MPNGILFTLPVALLLVCVSACVCACARYTTSQPENDLESDLSPRSTFYYNQEAVNKLMNQQQLEQQFINAYSSNNIITTDGFCLQHQTNPAPYPPGFQQQQLQQQTQQQDQQYQQSSTGYSSPTNTTNLTDESPSASGKGTPMQYLPEGKIGHSDSESSYQGSNNHIRSISETVYPTVVANINRNELSNCPTSSSIISSQLLVVPNKNSVTGNRKQSNKKTVLRGDSPKILNTSKEQDAIR